LILKARVDDLQHKVREAAMRVKQLRATAPAKIEDALRRDLEKSHDALSRSLASCEVPSALPSASFAQPPSEACAEAFVEDVADVAAAVKRLRSALPEQIARSRRAIRVCQEWSGKGFSAAEQIVAEAAPAAAAAPSPQTRRLRTAAALAAR
jgi:hypothetical protein